jgi:tetratricopeptide (TPR) repeat protein
VGKESLGVAQAIDGLARVRRAQGNDREAGELFDRALALRRKILGSHHPDVAETLAALGSLRTETDPRSAEPLLRESLAIRRATYPGGHWEIFEATNLLGQCLHALGQTDEARALLQEGHAGLQRTLGDEHPITRQARARVRAAIRS